MAKSPTRKTLKPMMDKGAVRPDQARKAKATEERAAASGLHPRTPTKTTATPRNG